MFRPLSQRIRESAPVRLLLDNRLVRHFADKPVTAAPTRAQAVRLGLVPALAAELCLAGSYLVVAFRPDSFGGLLGLLLIAILLLGGLLIGRRLRSVICTIIATGLFFVFFKASVLLVSDYVLQTRGERVSAVVGQSVTNPTGCAATSAFTSRLTGNSSAMTVHRADGTPLPGAIGLGDRTFGDRHTYRAGERVDVLVDPDGAVCLRAASDVHLAVDTVAAALAAGCIAWVFLIAPLDWRIRRRAAYERWREHAL